jgi:hypothetical protein
MTVASGGIITAADMNRALRGGPEKPSCILRNSIVLNVANNGAVLTWDTEELDTHGFHSTSSNTSRITPNVAGWYRITSTVSWASNATGRRATVVYQNGASKGNGSIIPGGVSGVAAGVINTNHTRTLYANGTTDYFEINAYQNSGGILATASTLDTCFEVVFERE